MRSARLLAPLALLALPACSGGNFEVAGPVMARRGAALKTSSVRAMEFRIPQAEPFNIVYPSSQQSGAARAEARARPEGKASCRAACDGVGSADASFQLGYKFDVADDADLDTLVTLSVTGKCRVNSTDAQARGDLVTELIAFVKDSRNTIIHKETLLTDTGGALERQLTLRTTFPVKLLRNTGYYIVLSGHLNSSSRVETKLDATLDIDSAAIEIAHRADASAGPSTQPAP